MGHVNCKANPLRLLPSELFYGTAEYLDGADLGRLFLAGGALSRSGDTSNVSHHLCDSLEYRAKYRPSSYARDRLVRDGWGLETKTVSSPSPSSAPAYSSAVSFASTSSSSTSPASSSISPSVSISSSSSSSSDDEDNNDSGGGDGKSPIGVGINAMAAPELLAIPAPPLLILEPVAVPLVGGTNWFSRLELLHCVEEAKRHFRVDATATAHFASGGGRDRSENDHDRGNRSERRSHGGGGSDSSSKLFAVLDSLLAGKPLPGGRLRLIGEGIGDIGAQILARAITASSLRYVGMDATINTTATLTRTTTILLLRRPLKFILLPLRLTVINTTATTSTTTATTSFLYYTNQIYWHSIGFTISTLL